MKSVENIIISRINADFLTVLIDEYNFDFSDSVAFSVKTFIKINDVRYIGGDYDYFNVLICLDNMEIIVLQKELSEA